LSSGRAVASWRTRRLDGPVLDDRAARRTRRFGRYTLGGRHLAPTRREDRDVDDQAEYADDHQDHADGLDVDSIDGRVDGEREDRADCDEEQSSADAHDGLRIQEFRQAAEPLSYGVIPKITTEKPTHRMTDTEVT
jgi:hypothetical protein